MGHVRTWKELLALRPTQVERRLIRACKAGEPCVLGDGLRPEAPDPERNIRAEILRHLILGGCDGCATTEGGIWLDGAYITGTLDLDFTRAKGLTRLVNSRFENRLEALQARLELLNLAGSALPGIMAQGAAIAGHVFLRNGFVATDTVDLNSAKIGGQLECEDGRFENPGGDALNTQGAEIGGSVFLRGGFVALGAVDLNNARIGGQLECQGGRFENPGGNALNAQAASFGGSVFLRDRFEARGTVDLNGARIGGQLSCSAATFHNPGGYAIYAQGIEVKGSVFLSDRFRARGSVDFNAARIGGQLNCICGWFSYSPGIALNAQNIVVTGSVFLREGFVARGKVDLNTARIGGQLECTQCRFRNSGDFALNVDSADITGAVLMSNRFGATGEVRLSGTRIHGQLACDGGRFRNAYGDALNAQRMVVTNDFFWRRVSVPEGSVDLVSARVGDLVDDIDSWPPAGRLLLNGFTYERIGIAFSDARTRLDWLSRGTVWAGEFYPQPYRQLARVLGDVGHDDAARDVLVEQARLVRLHARMRAFREASGRPGAWARLVHVGLAHPFRRFWDRILRLGVGYGYKPGRSLWAMLGLIVIASLLSLATWRAGELVPRSDGLRAAPEWTTRVADRATYPNPAADWVAATRAGREYERFYPIAYGFDLVVPLIQIGQDAAWRPTAENGPWSWGWILWWGRWWLASLGWIVTALGAAAVTGVIRRE